MAALSSLTQESAPQRDNTASLPVYLNWAVSGVTLAKWTTILMLSMSALWGKADITDWLTNVR